jgi:electron transport complex protein RnfD
LLVNFALTAAAALLTEAAILRLRGRNTRHALRDGSALVTGALLSFALPPFVPFWIPLIGGDNGEQRSQRMFNPAWSATYSDHSFRRDDGVLPP